MKVVLFCGGFGLRMREASDQVPKALIPVGQEPIILHIMKYYAHYGHKEFILCLGYQGNVSGRSSRMAEDDVVDSLSFCAMAGLQIELRREARDWKITFVETGCRQYRRPSAGRT